MNRTSLWVADPETGREYDVAPLFETMHVLDRPGNTSLNTSGRDAINRTLRTLNVTVHDPLITPPQHLANLYKDLHLLSDMFEQIVEKPS